MRFYILTSTASIFFDFIFFSTQSQEGVNDLEWTLLSYKRLQCMKSFSIPFVISFFSFRCFWHQYPQTYPVRMDSRRSAIFFCSKRAPRELLEVYGVKDCYQHIFSWNIIALIKKPEGIHFFFVVYSGRPFNSRTNALRGLYVDWYRTTYPVISPSFL